MAFAGFSPGEAEGLRRAMSRKRSAEAIEAYHQRFLDGARETHGVGEEVAERVYGMIVGFSGFGFPKAHGAAFGLLAYQSTWLRVHHGPEFVCALLNEQPMGFYAPDTLAHEAQRRGIALAPPDVNASEALCTVEWVPEMGPLPADALAAARWSGAPARPGLGGRGGRPPRRGPRARRTAPRPRRGAARASPPPRRGGEVSRRASRAPRAPPRLPRAARRRPALAARAATSRRRRAAPRRRGRRRHPERDRAARARVRARGQGGGGQGARRRSGGGRAVPFAGGSGLAGGRRAALAGPARVGGRVRLADRRLVRARAAHGAVAARGGGAGGAGARGDAALAAARGAGRAGAAAAHAVGVDDRRLRDDRAHARRAPDAAAAAVAGAGDGVDRGPRAAAAQHGGQARRARRRAPAPGDGQGDRVPAARGRVRDDQPDRAARSL